MAQPVDCFSYKSPDRSKCEPTLQNEMCRAVIHDMRSPLATIMMAVDLLKSQDSADALQIIERSGQRMLRLIDDLTKANRQSGFKWDYNFTENQVSEILAEALSSKNGEARAKSIEIISRDRSGEIRIFCDRDRVVQVLCNLLGNGIKFSPANSNIVVNCLDHETEVEISIEDFGPGITADSVCKIFEKYWKVDANSQVGEGLGLFISKSIVEDHGGRIWVESDGQNGSRFIFVIPKAT